MLKNGEIKYQEKKFNVDWNNYKNSGKKHLVNYLIRDHFSNCFYAEIHLIDELPEFKDFLFNAWKQKENFEFCGIPKCLILGKHVIEKYPKIRNLETNLEITIELAKNGFATGIRSLRDWETNIRYYTCFENYKTLKGFQENIEIICRDINLRASGKTEENLKKWATNKPQGKLINDKSQFDKFYNK